MRKLEVLVMTSAMIDLYLLETEAEREENKEREVMIEAAIAEENEMIAEAVDETIAEAMAEVTAEVTAEATVEAVEEIAAAEAIAATVTEKIEEGIVKVEIDLDRIHSDR